MTTRVCTHTHIHACTHTHRVKLLLKAISPHTCYYFLIIQQNVEYFTGAGGTCKCMKTGVKAKNRRKHYLAIMCRQLKEKMTALQLKGIGRGGFRLEQKANSKQGLRKKNIFKENIKSLPLCESIHYLRNKLNGWRQHVYLKVWDIKKIFTLH